VSAASTIVSRLFAWRPLTGMRRDESRRRRHECPRHGEVNGGEVNNGEVSKLNLMFSAPA
jgi:hypothetical protein